METGLKRKYRIDARYPDRKAFEQGSLELKMQTADGGFFTYEEFPLDNGGVRLKALVDEKTRDSIASLDSLGLLVRKLDGIKWDGFVY